jgi:hypothetical protein
MSTQKPSWFSFSLPESTALPCAACGQEADLGPGADHHPRACPSCGVESAFLNWKGRVVQIIPGRAPPALAAALRWAQQHFDEIEYVEFVGALEELADSLDTGSVHTQSQIGR